jgi:hypothetical protein
VSPRCEEELDTKGVLGTPTNKNPEDSNQVGVEATQYVFLYLPISYDRRC